MGSRRTFVRQLAAAAGAIPVAGLLNSARANPVTHAATNSRVTDPAFFEGLAAGRSARELATDEDFWRPVQEAYTVDSNIIILNNGGVSPAPLPVQQALIRNNQLANEGPSYFMWRILDQGREPLRQKLATLAGTLPDEIAINRNATEALNTVIYGLPLKAGDEVIGTKQDYPNMIQAWKQRAERDGIVYNQLSFDFPIEDDETIVRAFEQAITPQTRILHVTHVINWVGQIMPVAKLCKLAHSHGIEVIVDGAHSFGLLDFKIPDLGCDYFGTSLHKFLSAPVGSGMMYIKKEKIAKVWPLLCNGMPHSEDIRKFETLGTRSFPIEQAIGEAVNFQNAIGSKRKEERVRYLKNYWAKQAVKIPKVRIHTSLKDAYSCAICGVTVDGMTPQQLDGALFTQYKIHTVGIVWENISCVRVTPHVYTRLEDLDKLVTALKDIAGKA